MENETHRLLKEILKVLEERPMPPNDPADESYYEDMVSHLKSIDVRVARIEEALADR